MKEYRITSIQEYITAVRSLIIDFSNVKLWWRGQADADWKLTPGIFRRGNETNESDIISLFRMKAKSRYLNCPNNDSPYPWLFLMQHYRLPTRLLDWTESPLVALYFAVENENNFNKDAIVWGLQPYMLNLAQANKKIVLSPGNLELLSLFTEAVNKNERNPDLRILAVNTEQIDIRHLIQQSEFTVHGTPHPINDLNESERFLGKIVIPASKKRELQYMLGIFGITRSYLFPDLENLSVELSSLNFQD